MRSRKAPTRVNPLPLPALDIFSEVDAGLVFDPRERQEKARGHKVAKVSFAPNPGPQTEFYNSDADIVIYGGQAGGGKTFALVLEAAKHTKVKGFTAVIFRRTLADQKKAGGPWDQSYSLYRSLGGNDNQTELKWKFPSGASIAFGHLEHEKNKMDWDGSEITYIGFDELIHFTESQFFYLLSRNRSTCKIKPYVRATTNPGPGWVKRLVAPWIDPLHEQHAQPGEKRWFTRDENDAIKWVAAGTPGALSMTYIPASRYDNPPLMAKHGADYDAKLNALPADQRRRLKDGDWHGSPPHRVLWAFDEGVHAIEPFEIPDHWPIYFGSDFGSINGADIAAAVDPETKIAYVFGECWPGVTRTTTERVYDIKRMCGRPNRSNDTYCRIGAKGWGGNQNTESDSRELLRSKGLDIGAPDIKEVKVQYDAFNDAFEAGKIFVFRTCPKLIAMMNQFQRKLGKDGSPLDEYDDKNFHLCAAGRYLFSKLYPPKTARDWNFF